MPIARAGEALSGTEQKPDATPGNPFPADNLIDSGLVSTSAETPQIAKHEQNSGHGEGPIYNIFALYFQMRRLSLSVRGQVLLAKRMATGARTSGNMRSDTLRRFQVHDERFRICRRDFADCCTARLAAQRSDGNLSHAAAFAGISGADGAPAVPSGRSRADLPAAFDQDRRLSGRLRVLPAERALRRRCGSGSAARSGAGDCCGARGGGAGCDAILHGRGVAAGAGGQGIRKSFADGARSCNAGTGSVLHAGDVE